MCKWLGSVEDKLFWSSSASAVDKQQIIISSRIDRVFFVNQTHQRMDQSVDN